MKIIIIFISILSTIQILCGIIFSAINLSGLYPINLFAREVTFFMLVSSNIFAFAGILGWGIVYIDRRHGCIHHLLVRVLFNIFNSVHIILAVLEASFSIYHMCSQDTTSRTLIIVLVCALLECSVSVSIMCCYHLHRRTLQNRSEDGMSITLKTSLRLQNIMFVLLKIEQSIDTLHSNCWTTFVAGNPGNKENMLKWLYII